jgi:hypothetical protein
MIPFSVHFYRKMARICLLFAFFLRQRFLYSPIFLLILQRIPLKMWIQRNNSDRNNRNQEDKLAGRVEKFSSSEEMFKSLGI